MHNGLYDISLNGGDGGYTKYATQADKNLGSSLLRTPTGRQQFSKLVHADIPVTVSVLEGRGKIENNNHYTTGLTNRTSISGKATKVDIEIYKGRINDFMRIVGDYYEAGRQNELGYQSRLYHENTTSMSERVAAVAGHEIEHATSKANYVLGKTKQAEVIPEKIETQILEETPLANPVDNLTPTSLNLSFPSLDFPTLNF